MNRQRKRVLEYIRANGSITQLEALRELGIMSLSSRISELKKSGEPIRKEMIRVKNRYGESSSIAKYTLGEQE